MYFICENQINTCCKKHLPSLIANDEGYNQSQRRFPSILTKYPLTLHYKLRMDRNRHLTTYLEEMSSPITILERLPVLYMHNAIDICFFNVINFVTKKRKVLFFKKRCHYVFFKSPLCIFFKGYRECE